MHSLLDPGSEFYLPRRLERMGQRAALLLSGGRPEDLPPALVSDMPCLPVPAELDRLPDGIGTFILVAPRDEESSLTALRQRFPSQRFVGLGADVFPALLARANPLDQTEAPPGPPCRSLTLILCTPRSGSSHLADLLTELGQGDCREHLRGDLAQALASDYRFDTGRALHRFLWLLGKDNQGRATTKLILGHLLSWLDRRPDPRPLLRVLDGVRVQTIILDRRDRLAQAVSGFMAQASGVWQLRDDSQTARIDAVQDHDYDFPTLFWRFQSYLRQGQTLDQLARTIPDCLRLDHDRDIAGVPAETLAARLSHRFGWPFDPKTYRPKPAHTRPTAAPAAPAFVRRFAADLDEMGLCQPMPRASPAVPGPALVLIGFNKCATLSLSDLFRRSGHRSAHWRTDDGRFLAPLIFANLHLGRPLFDGLSDYRVLSDLFYLTPEVYLEANGLFEQMAQQYPATRFLLNTRDREAWVASRAAHETPGAGRIIDRSKAYFGLSEDGVKDLWRAQWDSHHQAVGQYFRDRPNRFLEFHIERDSPEILSRWLGAEWAIDPARMRHLNQRALRRLGPSAQAQRLEQDLQPQPWPPHSDTSTAEDPMPPPEHQIDINRQQFLSVARALSQPFGVVAATGRPLAEAIPFEAAADTRPNRKDHNALEAIIRLLAGFAPALELRQRQMRGAPDRQLKLLQGLLLRTVKDHLPLFQTPTVGGQALVEAGFLAQALLRAPTALWRSLPGDGRDILRTALAGSRGITPNLSNWLLFPAMVETALLHLDGTGHPEPTLTALNAFEDWYLGDGQYGDGPLHSFDYYGGFVIHPMLDQMACTLSAHLPGWAQARPMIRTRFDRYCEVLERLIAPDGSFPPLGRSLAYRAAAFQPLGMAALRPEGHPTLSPGRLRVALMSVLRRTLQGTEHYGPDGWLRIGLGGAQPGLAETYISTGSLYLASQSLIVLGLPRKHRFWTDPAEPTTQMRLWGSDRNCVQDDIANQIAEIEADITLEKRRRSGMPRI